MLLSSQRSQCRGSLLTLSLKGYDCQATSIEINKTNDTLTIIAPIDEGGYHTLQCRTPESLYYLELDEDFLIRGTELWRYDAKMGKVFKKKIVAKDRLCSASGCHYWDFIKINQVNENKINFWVHYDVHGGLVLSGDLTR